MSSPFRRSFLQTLAEGAKMNSSCGACSTHDLDKSNCLFNSSFHSTSLDKEPSVPKLTACPLSPKSVKAFTISNVLCKPSTNFDERKMPEAPEVGDNTDGLNIAADRRRLMPLRHSTDPSNIDSLNSLVSNSSLGDRGPKLCFRLLDMARALISQGGIVCCRTSSSSAAKFATQKAGLGLFSMIKDQINSVSAGLLFSMCLFSTMSRAISWDVLLVV